MLGCRYIFVSVITFALAFLPVFCPCTDSVRAASAQAGSATPCVEHSKPVGGMCHCNQCPCKSDQSMCHQHFLRAMPAVRTSLMLPHLIQLLSITRDLLSAKIWQIDVPAGLSRRIHTVDLSTHTLLCQHCALVI